MISRWSAISGFFALACFVLAGGCDDPAHQQQLDRHTESMGRAIDFFSDTESRRPENLANLGRLAVEQNEQDIARTSQNPGLVGREIEDEFQRFHDRQPEYKQRIEEQFRGKPDNIKHTLPYMIY